MERMWQEESLVESLRRRAKGYKQVDPETARLLEMAADQIDHFPDDADFGMTGEELTLYAGEMVWCCHVHDEVTFLSRRLGRITRVDRENAEVTIKFEPEWFSVEYPDQDHIQRYRHTDDMCGTMTKEPMGEIERVPGR